MAAPSRAFWLLLIVGVSLAVPLLAADGCDDDCIADSCGDHCGDCASCPFVAELHGAASRLDLISTTVQPVAELLSGPDHPRALDHVPLPSP
jgi:hypothetical protein